MNIVTIKELAPILKVKEKTLYQWAELRQIPCLKLCGSLRFDLDEINQWMNACRIESCSSYNPLTQNRGPRKRGGYN